MSFTFSVFFHSRALLQTPTVQFYKASIRLTPLLTKTDAGYFRKQLLTFLAADQVLITSRLNWRRPEPHHPTFSPLHHRHQPRLLPHYLYHAILPSLKGMHVRNTAPFFKVVVVSFYASYRQHLVLCRAPF